MKMNEKELMKKANEIILNEDNYTFNVLSCGCCGEKVFDEYVVEEMFKKFIKEVLK